MKANNNVSCWLTGAGRGGAANKDDADITASAARRKCSGNAGRRPKRNNKTNRETEREGGSVKEIAEVRKPANVGKLNTPSVGRGGRRNRS